VEQGRLNHIGLLGRALSKAAVPVLLVLANDTGKPAAFFDFVQQAPPNDFRRRPDPFAITGGAAGVDR